MALKRYKVIGDANNSDLVGNSFTNGASNAVFTLGTFNVTTNLSGRKVNDYSKLLGSGVSTNLSLDNLGINNEESLLLYNNSVNKIDLSFDVSDLKSYVRYGSAYEFIRVSLQNILYGFPASLYLGTMGGKATTYNNYIYDSGTNTSSFTIYGNLIQNPFGLVYNIDNLSTPNGNSLNNLNLSYNKYSIYIPQSNIEYPIISFTGISINKIDVEVIAIGNPFSGTTSGIIDYHIKPQPQYINQFKSTLNRFESYILSNRKYGLYNGGYDFILNTPTQSESGDITYVNQKIFWNCSDGYNIDISGSKYNIFLKAITTIGMNYDMVSSDTIARLLVEEAIIKYDTTENKKISKLLRIYGASFDTSWQYINAIKYINNITYNKKNNAPDVLIGDLTKKYGWPSALLVSGNNTINSGLSNLNITGSSKTMSSDTIDYYFNKSSEISKNILTPNEINTEVWRRVLLNTAFFFKSKGTRDSLLAMARLMGVPNNLIMIDEYVYTVDNPIIPSQVSDSTITNLKSGFNNLPYDSDGYPKAPLQSNDFYFQKSYLTGDTNGAYYMDNFRDVGFILQPKIDNRKSWVYTGNTQRVNDKTWYYANYPQKDSKLVLNTKFIGGGIDVSKGVEDDVFNTINTGCTSGIPINLFPSELIKDGCIDWTNITFPEFLELIQTRLINPRNRKVITDNNGGFYPTIQRIFNEYLKYHPEASSYNTLLNNASQYSNIFGGLLESLMPSGVPNSNDGIIVRNTVFNKQKFTYKRGVSQNDLLEWLGDDGSEFKVSYTDVLVKASNSGSPCEGGIIQLFVNGVGSEYSWSGPNSFSSIEQNPIVTTSATTNNEGIYVVNVIVDQYTTYSATTEVTVNQTPIPLIVGNDNICVGGVLSLSGSPDGMISYLWEKDNISIGTNQQIYEISGVTNLDSGVYKLNVIDIHGCTASDSMTITLNSGITYNLTVGSNSPNNEISYGGNLVLSATTGLNSYSWSGPNGFTGNTDLVTISGVTLSNGGSYNVMTTDYDVNGCLSSVSGTTNVLISSGFMYVENVDISCETPFSYTINMYSDTIYQLPTTYGYNYDSTIDWGDGTLSKITGATDPNIVHTYPSGGIYQIKIYGLFESFKTEYANYPYLDSLKIISIDTPMTTEMGVINFGLKDCYSVHSVCDYLFVNCSGITDFSSMFENCYSLNNLPTDLFRYNTGITTMHRVFYSCLSLTAIPEDLFYYNNNVIDYSQSFYNCHSFTLPIRMFNISNLGIVTNWDSFMNTPNSPTGIIQKIWSTIDSPAGDVTYIVEPTKLDAFQNCVSISNYATIPTNWI